MLVLLAACSCSDSPAAPGTTRGAVRVLMLSATSGFRHDSIETARQVMAALAPSNGFQVTFTEDISSLTARLVDHDVLFFALTSGELPFDAAQRAVIVDFVAGGKGFVGVHSAADTLYDWPEYGQLVGAYFKEHPWTQPGTVVVEDRTHPATRGLGERFTLLEEFYTFRDNPRGRVQVLL